MGRATGVYCCALGGLFRYLLEQGGAGRSGERTLPNPEVMTCSRLHYGKGMWIRAPCEKTSYNYTDQNIIC